MASMMPAYSQTSAGSLPNLDEATAPFSSLFDNHFDRATVEATVPLADRAIFVAANGRRYKFESTPDVAPECGDQREDRVGNIVSSVPGALTPSPNSQTHALWACQAAPTTREYQSQRNAYAIPRRPVFGTSAGLQQTASGRGLPEDMATRGVGEPGNAADDLSPSMAQLNIRRFSATPFFADSDGGVLAAETLTDLDPNPRLPIPPSPAVQHATTQPPTSASRSPNFQGASLAPQPYLGGRYPSQPPLMSPAGAVDPYYGYRPPELEAQYQGARHPSLPSLVGQASPIPHSLSTSDMHGSRAYPSHQPGYSHTPPPNLSANFGLSPRNASSPAISHLGGLQHDEQRRQSQGSSLHGPLSSPSAQATRLYHHPTGESHFDTQTPVVVVPESGLHSVPHQGSTSSGASTGRDNVLPGEDVLFDG